MYITESVSWKPNVCSIWCMCKNSRYEDELTGSSALLSFCLSLSSLFHQVWADDVAFTKWLHFFLAVSDSVYSHSSYTYHWMRIKTEIHRKEKDIDNIGKQQVKLGGEVFDQVTKFVYLGEALTEDGTCTLHRRFKKKYWHVQDSRNSIKWGGEETYNSKLKWNCSALVLIYYTIKSWKTKKT